MPGPIHVQIPAGTTASSAFCLFPADHLVALFVASHATASEIRLGFSPTSGGPLFGTLNQPDGTGSPFVVHSGGGPGWCLVKAPTPFGRVQCLNAPSTDPRSISLFVVS